MCNLGKMDEIHPFVTLKLQDLNTQNFIGNISADCCSSELE